MYDHHVDTWLMTESNEQFALVEGWAEFVQNAMYKDWQNYLLNGTHTYINNDLKPKYGEAHEKTDIEDNNWWMGPDIKEENGKYINPNGNSGKIVEGAIASILWDIYDDKTDEDEPEGGIDNGLKKIMITMDDYHPDNIIDFYFNFIREYSDEAKLNAIFQSHGINPYELTAGDVTVDGQDDIICNKSNGFWYYDVAKSKWTAMSSYHTTGDIAAGDFTGDGVADVASIWSSGLWYQNGASFSWKKVTIMLLMY